MSPGEEAADGLPVSPPPLSRLPVGDGDLLSPRLEW